MEEFDLEVIKIKKVKSFREHTCYTCGSKIYKGEEYDYQTNIKGGEIYNWKQCYKCKPITDRMFREGYYPDGISGQDFAEFISDNGIDFKIN